MPGDQPIFGRSLETVLVDHTVFHIREMAGSVKNADFLFILPMIIKQNVSQQQQPAKFVFSHTSTLMVPGKSMDPL